MNFKSQGAGLATEKLLWRNWEPRLEFEQRKKYRNSLHLPKLSGCSYSILVLLEDSKYLVDWSRFTKGSLDIAIIKRKVYIA